MKVAILCNGPSRNLYSDSSQYNYIIGCNIPWTKVDSTVVLDADVLLKMNTPQRFYCGNQTWMNTPIKVRNKLIGYLASMIKTLPDYDSTGHAAARTVIEMGATEIDIYGCDSWFGANTDSHTHQWVDSRPIDMNKHVSVWRARWYELMASHPDIVFNFIGEPK